MLSWWFSSTHWMTCNLYTILSFLMCVTSDQWIYLQNFKCLRELCPCVYVITNEMCGGNFNSSWEMKLQPGLFCSDGNPKLITLDIGEYIISWSRRQSHYRSGLMVVLEAYSFIQHCFGSLARGFFLYSCWCCDASLYMPHFMTLDATGTCTIYKFR